MADENQAADEGAGGDSASSVDNSNYDQRIRRDPDFASSEVKKFQSTSNRLEGVGEKFEAQTQQIGGLKDSLEQFGGDRIKESLNRYIQILNHPEWGQKFKDFEQTGGQLPDFKGSNGHDDLDDEDLMTESEIEIASLSKRLAASEARQNQSDVITGKDFLQRHMATALSEFDFEPEDREAIESGVGKDFDGFGQSEDGIRTIRQLSGPNGEKAVRTMVMSHVTPKRLRAAAARAGSTKRSRLDRMSTDSPSGGGSGGMVEMPDHGGNARKAFRLATENPELLKDD